MSFLLDPPLLVAAGAAIEAAVPDERRDLAAAVTAGAFIGVSVMLYLDVPGLGFLWRPFRSSGGRDFMWNSGVFRIAADQVGAPAHAAAGAQFALYPVWLALGRCLGRRLAPRARPAAIDVRLADPSTVDA